MRIARRLLIVNAVLGVMVHAMAIAADGAVPKGVQLPKDVKVPNDTALAIYIPTSEVKSRFYVSTLGIWAEPGKALDDARRELGPRFFSQTLPVDFASDGSYGLLLAINPKWRVEKGNLQLEMHYKVLGIGSQQLLEGTQMQSVGLHSPGPLGGFPNAALRVTQLVLVDVLRKLQPNGTKFPASGQLTAINLESLVDRTAPVSTGTAFYINKSGQLMPSRRPPRVTCHQSPSTPVRLISSHSQVSSAEAEIEYWGVQAGPTCSSEKGTLMSPWLNSLFSGWVDIFGGRQSARTIHFIAASLIVLFVLIHVFEVIVTGFWNNLRSMITGNYRVSTQTNEGPTDGTQ